MTAKFKVGDRVRRIYVSIMAAERGWGFDQIATVTAVSHSNVEVKEYLGLWANCFLVLEESAKKEPKLTGFAKFMSKTKS